MTAHAQLDRDEPVLTLYEPETIAWNSATVVAFRFCFVYFGLYVLSTQMIGGFFPLPFFNPEAWVTLAVKPVVIWVGANLLRLHSPVTYVPTGSGDTLHDWVQAFTLLLVAAVVTAIWSSVSRGKRSHERLFKWFRLFIRVALGTTMFSYGLVKAIPLQMPVLSLTRLVEPFGNFSPMGVLWYSIGAAPAYEIFLGVAETLAGLLLFLPRTTTLGASMCLMLSTGVFAVNMTYDVPVKLFSFHLILMSAFLLAPDADRLLSFYVRGRAAHARPEPLYGQRVATQRVIPILLLVFGAVSLGTSLYQNLSGWKQYGGGAPKSPLYGIWNVQSLVENGVPRQLLISDSTQWRYVIFQQPGNVAMHQMNDSLQRFGADIDTVAHTIKLTGRDKTANVFTYQRPTIDSMVMSGTLDGRSLQLSMHRRDPDSYRQRSRGFNWIQEMPFNR